MYYLESENILNKIESFKLKQHEEFKKISKNIKKTSKFDYDNHVKNMNKLLLLEDYVKKITTITKIKNI